MGLLTLEKREELQRLLEEGKTSQKDLARQFDISGSTVAYWAGKREDELKRKKLSRGRPSEKKIITYPERKYLVAEPTNTTRPMVAFIGTHSEITAAIKELFS